MTFETAQKRKRHSFTKLEKRLLWLYLNYLVEIDELTWNGIESSIEDFHNQKFYRKYFERLRDGTLQYQRTNDIYTWVTGQLNTNFSFEAVTSDLVLSVNNEDQDDPEPWISIPNTKNENIIERLGLNALELRDPGSVSFSFRQVRFAKNLVIFRAEMIGTMIFKIYFAEIDGNFRWLDRSKETNIWISENAALELRKETALEYVSFYNFYLRADSQVAMATPFSVSCPTPGKRTTAKSMSEFYSVRRPAVVTELEQEFGVEYDALRGLTVYRERCLLTKSGNVDIERVRDRRTLLLNAVPESYLLPRSVGKDFQEISTPLLKTKNKFIKDRLFRELQLSFFGQHFQDVAEEFCDELVFYVGPEIWIFENPLQRRIVVFSPIAERCDIEKLTFCFLVGARRYEQALLGFKADIDDHSALQFTAMLHSKSLDSLRHAIMAIDGMEEVEAKRYDRIFEEYNVSFLRQAYRDGWTEDEIIQAYLES